MLNYKSNITHKKSFQIVFLNTKQKDLANWLNKKSECKHFSIPPVLSITLIFYFGFYM